MKLDTGVLWCLTHMFGKDPLFSPVQRGITGVYSTRCPYSKGETPGGLCGAILDSGTGSVLVEHLLDLLAVAGNRQGEHQ